MNIVFVVSDTLRRDRLGCYGNPWIRTPNLDRFAKEAIVFDHAYEASFATVPTRADFLTGKLTMIDFGWAPLPPKETTLPQRLAEAGYFTMGIADTPFYLRADMNYDRGFADFVWIRGQGAEREDYNRSRHDEIDYCAPRTFHEAEKWLERNCKTRPVADPSWWLRLIEDGKPRELPQPKPFFLLIDTWDPHEPWDPPSYYVEPYLPGYDGKVVDPVYGKYRGRVSEADLRIAHACYAGEITMVDFWFGRLMNRLESLGLLDDTTVIFTSDHGFYFGEHGYFGKASLRDGGWDQSKLYDEVTRVPLLIRKPGIKPNRVSSLVTHPDLMPTILELAGVKPPKGIFGKSVLPLMKGSRKPLHDVVISSWQLYTIAQIGAISRMVDGVARPTRQIFATTIFDGEWTLIYSVEGEPVELYHTLRDPQQKRNVFRKNRAKAKELHAKFYSTLLAQGASQALLETRRKL